MIAGLRTVVPLSSICAIANVSQRTLKRRLKKLNDKHPGLLMRFADDTHGRIYADMARLKQLLPAYVEGLDDAREGIDRVLQEIEGVKATCEDTHRNVAALRDNFAAMMP